MSTSENGRCKKNIKAGENDIPKITSFMGFKKVVDTSEKLINPKDSEVQPSVSYIQQCEGTGISSKKLSSSSEISVPLFIGSRPSTSSDVTDNPVSVVTDSTKSDKHQPLTSTLVGNQVNATLGSSPALSDCQLQCCKQAERFTPTTKQLKTTSVKQITGKDRNKRVRLCPETVFAKYDWVTYCLSRGTISCYYCREATSRKLNTLSYHKEDAFISGCFSDWKKCQEKLDKHKLSHSHYDATSQIINLNDTKINVGAALDKQYKAEQQRHQMLFLKQISSLRYIARQGLALRGHGDNDIEGNLIQLLKLRSEDVPELNSWITEGHYLSPEIINELLEMMANNVLRALLDDIRQSLGLFSLIADESRDISNREQLSCVLRWVSLPNLEIHEDFIGMYILEKADAETITASLKDIILRCNLRLEDCRWQAYDGAATMSGHLSGVAARILAENNRAHHIHCANHRLDLALKSSACESNLIGSTLTFVQDLAVFIRHSPQRMAMYEDISKDLYSDRDVESVHTLCPTRGTARTNSILAVINNYQAIHSTLLKISNTGSTQEVRYKAAGLADSMSKFKIFFGLHLSINIFSVSEQLAKTLQSKSILAQTAKVGVSALKQNLQRQRDEFNTFYRQTQKQAETTLGNIVGQPVLPRQRKIPRRLQHGNAESHTFQTVQDLYRVEYVEAIDVCLAEISRRFSKNGYDILENIEQSMLNAANGNKFAFSEDVLASYDKELDFNQINGEMKLLPGIINQTLPEVKTVSSMDIIFEAISSQTTCHLVPNVLRLAQIYMLAPISSASAERSFSFQRKIKNYLRSTMTERRYNNLLVLNIHKERTDKIDINSLVKDFIQKNERRLKYFGKVY